MDDYLKEVALQRICGIEATHWRTFFKAFQEQATLQSVQEAIEKFLADLKKDSRAADPTVLASVQKIMDELKKLVSG
jgi:N-glycosylase/DNA lyase